MIKYIKILLVSILLFIPTFAHSATITLAQNQNADVDIAGYKIYYGIDSNNYTYAVDTYNATYYTIDVPDDKIVYIALAAYDIQENESSKSHEINVYSDGPQPVEGIKIIPQDRKTVILQQTPNTEPGLSGYKIYYNRSDKPEDVSTQVAGNVTSCIITGLTPNKWYDFVITSYDKQDRESEPSIPISVELRK